MNALAIADEFTRWGMRPTTQTVEGYPFGSCVECAYATILGKDIRDIPRLDPGAVGNRQGDAEREWLASIGLSLFEISTNDPNEELPDEVIECAPPVPHLMSGISPRGFGHRVVGIGGQVAWDPHPSRAGLVTVYSIGILVPLEMRP